MERPVENDNETVSVQVGLALQQIVDLVCLNKAYSINYIKELNFY